MKPAAFRYYDPNTVAEAIDLLAASENAKLLAGGQSLLPMLNMRYLQPDDVIDLNKISELAYIREVGEIVHIGAMTRQCELETSPSIREKLPLMHEGLMNVGHRQTRNRGTIGGSLCHLDPAAELPTVLMAYDGVLEVRGLKGRRDVPIGQFAASYMAPAISADEIVTGMRLPSWPKGHGSAFVEFARRRGDFAMVSVAVLIDIEGDTVRRASVTVGGLSFSSQRVAEAENRLRGAPATDAVFCEAAKLCESLRASGDIHGSADYRRHLARVLAFRALIIARQRAGVQQSTGHA